MAKEIFYITSFLLFYTFLGYPLFLYFLSFFMKNKLHRGVEELTITIVIPVHNEQSTIRAKIQNCLEIDYPRQQVHLVVVSDCSTDNTEKIVKTFDPQRVSFLAMPFRGGKVAAQNYALNYCDSDIIIFTDVAISTSPESIRLIVQNFSDPNIGAVSCRDMIVGEERHSKGEKSYIQYDMLVRKFASQVHTLIGVTGGFYAVRKEIAKGGWNPAFPPDFYVALRCIKRGLRVIEDSRVKAFYKTAAKDWDELPRKVRTINRGMTALFAFSNRNLLNPFQYGMISFELISHKLFRWFMPLFFIILYISNMFLINDTFFYALIFGVQTCFFLVAIFSIFAKGKFSKQNYIKFARYFMIANLAILKSWFELIVGRKYVMWQPTKR